MAMNRIGRPPLIQPNVLERFQKSGDKREVDSGHGGKQTPQTAAGGQVGDRVEISDRARQLDDLRRSLVAGQSALDRVPDVRKDKIAQARARLQTGYYSAEEVRQEVAAKLGAVIRKLDEL